jgi:TRAP-type C4-dicarboxylate transport system permease small subunit
VAVLGGAFACIAIVLISLGLFQPSSNARKFALAAYATLQYFNIRNRYRFPINGKDTPESMMEMPIPLLIALQTIALVGALFSRTDGERAQIVRNKKKAALYAKHAVKVAKKD